LPGFLLIDPPFAAKVLTIVGLPPTPCRLDLFLLTALDFSPLSCWLLLLPERTLGMTCHFFLMRFFGHIPEAFRPSF
jgi:hypothetical protein